MLFTLWLSPVMIAFIGPGLIYALVIALILLIVIIGLIGLDGRAALSLLNAKEQVATSREKMILSNVCFRLGAQTPQLFETARFAGSAFFIQSLFHPGWIILGMDLKKRLSDEEIEQLFASTAIRKKVNEYYFMVPISSLLMLFNLPFGICEKYQWKKLESFVSVFLAPFNAIITKLVHRHGLYLKGQRLLASSMGESSGAEAIWGKFSPDGGNSLYQAMCLQPLSLQMLTFDDPLLSVLFEENKGGGAEAGGAH